MLINLTNISSGKRFLKEIKSNLRKLTKISKKRKRKKNIVFPSGKKVISLNLKFISSNNLKAGKNRRKDRNNKLRKYLKEMINTKLIRFKKKTHIDKLPWKSMLTLLFKILLFRILKSQKILSQVRDFKVEEEQAEEENLISLFPKM